MQPPLPHSEMNGHLEDAKQGEIFALRVAFGDGELCLPHAYALRLGGLSLPAIGERLGLQAVEVQRAASRHAGALFGLFMAERIKARIQTHQVMIPMVDVAMRDRLTEGLRRILPFVRRPGESAERSAWERAMLRIRRSALYDMVPALERHAVRGPSGDASGFTGVNIDRRDLAEATRKQRAAAMLQVLASRVSHKLERSILLGLAAAAAFDRAEILNRAGMVPAPSAKIRVHVDLAHGSAATELRYGRALTAGPQSGHEDYEEAVRRAIRAATGIVVEGTSEAVPLSPVFAETDEEFFKWRLAHQATFEAEFVELVAAHSKMEGAVASDQISLLEDEEAEVPTL